MEKTKTIYNSVRLSDKTDKSISLVIYLAKVMLDFL